MMVNSEVNFPNIIHIYSRIDHMEYFRIFPNFYTNDAIDAASGVGDAFEKMQDTNQHVVSRCWDE